MAKQKDVEEVIKAEEKAEISAEDATPSTEQEAEEAAEKKKIEDERIKQGTLFKGTDDKDVEVVVTFEKGYFMYASTKVPFSDVEDFSKDVAGSKTWFSFGTDEKSFKFAPNNQKLFMDGFLQRCQETEDDEEEEQENEDQNAAQKDDEMEEKEQERLAKRFAKRARMQRLIEAHGHEEEFSQSKLIEDDATMRLELQKMKVRR